MAKYLNSNHVYLLKRKDKVLLWIGKYSNPIELAHAQKSSTLLKSENIILIKEGEEPSEFWEYLNGKTSYVKFDEKDAKDSQHLYEPRLFRFSEFSGSITAVELDEFTQDSLQNQNCYLLHVWKEIYLWLGNSSSFQLKKKTMEVTAEYAKLVENAPVWIVKPTLEPIYFTSNFRAWTPKVFKNSNPCLPNNSKMNRMRT